MINKRAASGFVIVLALFYFFAGMILYQYLKPDITVARGADQMSCASPLTSGDMAVCLLLDFLIPIIIIGIFSTTGAIMTKEALF